jgi:hypothetical protein
VLDRRDFLRGLGALPLLPLTGTGCAHSPRSAVARPDRADEMARLGAEYERLMTRHGLHEWTRYAGQAHASEAEDAAAMRALRRQEQDVVTRAAALARDPAAGLGAREIELWGRARRAMLLLSDPRASELADRLEATLNDFAFEHDGKKLTRGDLRALARSDDPAQRRLSHRLHGELHRAAAPIARELLRRRRALAAEQGIGDFYPAMLELRGVDPARFTRLLAELDARTRDPFARAFAEAKRATGLTAAAPYDGAYLAKGLGDFPDSAFPADGALAFAHRVWTELGVSLDPPRVRIDVRDFAFSGQAISVHIPTDVRLVVAPAPGARFYSTVLHELGHAFASVHIRTAAPVLKGYEWIAGLTQPGYDEGLAEVFGNAIDERELMRELVPALDASQLVAALDGRRRAALLGFSGRLAAIQFEREALADPDQDLDALERRLQRDVQGYEVPDDLEPTWATSALLATYPVYAQSYLLAALFSHQVRATLRTRFGARWTVPAASAFLVETLVHDGAQTTMDQKLVRATGSPLAADAYLGWLLG